MVLNLLGRCLWLGTENKAGLPDAATLGTMEGVLREETLKLVEWLEAARDAIREGDFDAADTLLTNASAGFRNWPFYNVSPANPKWLTQDELLQTLED